MIENIKIIVPTLNSYSILPNLIKSLKKQSWSKWTLLFVDGKSSNDHFEWLIKSCKEDSRLKIIKQEDSYKGIFGAMNQGYETIKDNELVLFWGSDDWAFAPNVLEKIVNKIDSYPNKFDLVICKGKYINNQSKKLSRSSQFLNNKYSKILDKKSFRRKLFIGMTPPHQATFFNKRSFSKISSFSDNLKLASDLDYFLKFSKKEDISILVIEYDLVYISTNGISSQKNKLRLSEVLVSYINSFGIFFFIPFILRYIRKIFSKVFSKL